ncbi:hypothetical protein BG003_009593 [Podila horticola]|nr:hypothetical protein BG003_009593 [Podila horticola]
MDNIMVYLETVFDKEASLVAKSDLQLGVDQGTIAESSVIEKLECIDWEDMLTYLTDWDPWNKRPDGLYRILNDDGHISWHCPDHLRRTHVVALEYTVISSGGECDLADEGRIRLTLRCAPTMVRFLDQLRRAKVIRHLDLTLAWDTTLIDLMWLRDNLLYIGLRTLRLDCGGYTGPLYDCKNRSKRGDPFAHLLMSAHKLNRFCVRGADGVFSQSSVFTHTPTSLQEVHIESTFDPLVQQSKLETLIRMSPKLIFLSLSCRDDGFCRTVNIVRQSIMDHKTFRYLRLTSPSFAIQLDKNEPDSRLSVPPLPSEDLPKGQHLNPTYFILLDYGAHLSRITVGDNFYDAHVLLLRNIVASAHKLVQLDINVDTKIGTHSRVSNNGRAMLASIIPQLDNCHISVTSRFKEKHWVPFVASMYPFLNSVSLRTPDVNQRLQELSRLLVQGKVPSKIKTFTFIGTEFSMKAPTVQALVHILDSSPNLETLRLSHCHAKTMDDWRVILGAIRFDTLLRLSIRSNSFHDCSQGYFPVDAIPRDAVLQHLDMSKCSFPIVLKAALQKDLKERFPHLDIVF